MNKEEFINNPLIQFLLDWAMEKVFETDNTQVLPVNTTSNESKAQ